ncbi:tRNA (adenosine(37)-N6)-threonylcarbamoyltransferase complex dimerization subunit type 1 TsaB [Ferruginibacter sp. SUN002]|uniref:tRNA (adenosine(37)-N6)-threonylcarbamoyltransferase complex dimerization subunit type 1 TsaB n=1 Tax=Ferruginibacter sp. SUN002 TaxID=2937789 RepID=UPI003D36FC23
MAYILSIDTAMQSASVSLSKNGVLLHELNNRDAKDHGSFLQPAILKVVEIAGITLQQIDAVAVTEGPGSYTGLRVGMAAAKGLCFALNKPLITINTLEALAATALGEVNVDASTIICPMIDARRMEVYTALYKNDLTNLLEPHALVLNTGSFEKYFSTYKILFVGSGASKWSNICESARAVDFQNIEIKAEILNNLSYKKYNSNNFADIAYAEPFYLKEFFSETPK